MLVDFHKALFSPVYVTETRRHSSTVHPSHFIQSLNNPELSSSPSTTKICFNRSGIKMKFCLASLAVDEEQECRGVKKKDEVCMCVKDHRTLSSHSPCLFFFTCFKYSIDPQCGIISPFIPPLALFLPLHLLFLPPLPQSCVSLPFASTSLPLFSLTLKSSQSLLPFIYCFNMLAGGERGGCCARPSVLLCHPSGQRRLPLLTTQLPVVSA